MPLAGKGTRGVLGIEMTVIRRLSPNPQLGPNHYMGSYMFFNPIWGPPCFPVLARQNRECPSQDARGQASQDARGKLLDSFIGEQQTVTRCTWPDLRKHPKTVCPRTLKTGQNTPVTRCTWITPSIHSQLRLCPGDCKTVLEGTCSRGMSVSERVSSP